MPKEYTAYEQQVHDDYKTQAIVVNPVARILWVLPEAEIAGFQAKNQQYRKKTGISVKLRYHAIFSSAEGIGIERYQQIIQKAPKNAAQAVYGCLGNQLADWVQADNPVGYR